MNIDPNLTYQKMLEYEQYLADQQRNAVNLEEMVENPNDTIKLFADNLFAKDSRYLSSDRCGMLLDDTMTAEDIFCIMLELVLYGYDKKSSNRTLFDITSAADDTIYEIRPYLRSVGIVLTITEVFDCENVNYYRDRDDYYCSIGSQPPSFIDRTQDPWDILSYRMAQNRKFVVTTETPLTDFNAYFVSKTKQIFTLSFNIDLS